MERKDAIVTVIIYEGTAGVHQVRFCDLKNVKIIGMSGGKFDIAIEFDPNTHNIPRVEIING